MGYSARYHVASLAAVFLALGVGILIGTGLKSVVTDATHRLEDSLRGEIDKAQSKADDLQQQLGSERDFSDAAYPGLVGGMLKGDRIAVIALHDLDPGVKSAVQEVVGSSQAAGGRIQDYSVIAEPPDLTGLRSDLGQRRIAGQPARTVVRGGDVLEAAARRAGRTFSGGAFFRRIRSTLLDSQTGSPAGIDAVIVARSRPENLNPAEVDATDAFESGILDGLKASGLPVVGVETSTADSSSIGLYTAHGITSVDDVDQEAGRVSLVYGLQGVSGAFGVKSSADSLMPDLQRPTPIPPKGNGGRR
jgi:hypothetical protein